MSNPSSLVARIFKARYFPNSSLLNATRGGGSSFLWSGIWQAKEALKKGFRWVVGDGLSIDVFEDAWLRSKADFRTEPTNDRGDIVKVKDLFVPGVKSWDYQKVYNFFPNCDAEAILATPVPQAQAVDRMAWVHSVDGVYSVKSGYQFWQNTTGFMLHSEAGWNQLWKLEVPHKIKVFLWRFGRNNIPVRNKL